MIRPIQLINIISIYWRKSRSEKDLYNAEFIEDVNFINFNRLRIWGYALIILVLTQLYSDLFLGQFWTTGQLDYFMILDLILAFITACVVFITHFRPPKTKEEIKKFHIIFTQVYILLHLSWGAAISIVESSTAKGVPTYQLCVLFAASLFITRSIILLIFLIISLTTLLTGLYFTGLSINVMFTQYSNTIVLIAFAWVLSRLLYSTRKNTFHATKELEIARNGLDNTIKLRTAELIETNEKLVSEIRERKRYEKILEYEKKRAQEADRLKSVFLANMSHEIRTPLNGILGFSDLLQIKDLSNEKRARYHEIISSNSHQLLKIIDDIMDISMIESNQLKIKKTDFHLSELFPDTIEFFKNYMKIQKKEHLQLIMEGFPEGTNDYINSDSTRIQQVLYSLISNSIKFTDKGYVKVAGKNEKNFILVYVEDSGIGIQPQIGRVIFKAFRQGEETISRSYGGTGLGLSISKGIIALLDGMIWIDFSYKNGALFCFSIPIGENAFSNRILKSPKDFELLKRKNLLIVDDNTEESSFIADVFRVQKANISWIKFSTMKVNNTENKPDLIVFDTDKNDIQLSQILSQFSEIHKNVPLIVLLPQKSLYNSGNTEKPNIFVMVKPVNIQLMLVKCVEILSSIAN
jgi:signal transduction histidine kinase